MSQNSKRTLLITAALPYTNSYAHMGHLLEHFMVDFWGRFQKMRGHDCLQICASDTHGTPMMISAKKENTTPEKIVEKYHQSHIDDFNNFLVHHDNYSTTDTDENRKLSELFFSKMKKAGTIQEKEMEQAYCDHDKMFLPDRFVKGGCPKCKAEDQYGDNCEACNTAYSPLDMTDPICSLCSNPVKAKKTSNLFFQVNRFKEYLKDWIPKHNQEEISNKLVEWFDEDLKDWCISRDAPYFGFEIPGYKNKFFYVWVDAPVGYVSSTKEYCDKNNKNFEDYWVNKDSEIYHCIGKDIIYFHSLFWPAVLKTVGYNSPKKIVVHGMLNFKGAKMSKSKGVTIPPKVYLKYLDPQYLRYYLATKISGNSTDANFDFDDFLARVNSDLVGKITNVASRGASMLHKLDGTMGVLDDESREILALARNKVSSISEYYEKFNFAKALVEIREISELANKYFDKYEPWKLIKVDQDQTKTVLTTILNLFRIMAIALKPIVPNFSESVSKLFNEESYSWDDINKTLENYPINPYKHLIGRIDAKEFQKFKEECTSDNKTSKLNVKKSKKDSSTKNISIGDFQKIDLRVAKIVNANEVEGADKLLKLDLEIGDRTISVFSGIKSAYSAEQLIGKLTACIVNLEPRKMKFGLSEGMVLACGDGGKDLFLLSPDSGAKPGQRIT